MELVEADFNYDPMLSQPKVFAEIIDGINRG